MNPIHRTNIEPENETGVWMIDYKDERNVVSESEKIYPVFSRTLTFFPVRI